MEESIGVDMDGELIYTGDVCEITAGPYAGKRGKVKRYSPGTAMVEIGPMEGKVEYFTRLRVVERGVRMMSQ